MRPPQNRSRRIRATLIAATTAATAFTVPIGAAAIEPVAAYAGTWAEATCTLPLAGLPPGPIDGWTPVPAGGTATNGCNPYAGGLIASLSDAAPHVNGVGGGWTYTAPGGATIAGGSIVFQLYAPQGRAYVTTGTFANAIATCQGSSPCGGTIGGSSGALNLPIAPVGGTRIFASAECYGPGGGDCAANAGGSLLDAQVNIFQAIVDLSTSTTPVATNFGGGLLTPGPVAGTQPLTFTASVPQGPGVMSVAVSIDGQNVYAATPDTNSGQCVPIGKDQAGNNMFTSQQPCKPSVAVSVPVATAALADGAHALAVTVTDAAANSSVVLQQTLTTANHTTVSADLDSNHSTPPPPPTPATTPAPVYAITLDPATEPLTKGVQRPFTNSALTLAGTLRNSAGVPAPGVPIALLTQNGGAGNPEALARTTSDGTGHWTLIAPRGPSRLLTIVYGTQAQAASASAGVTINETVTPALSLSIHALRRGRLRFTGQLQINPLGDPRPQIVVEVGKGSRWQSVGQPLHLTPGGHYKLTYNAGPVAVGGHYTFRAVSAPTTLYTAATSPTRRTVVR